LGREKAVASKNTEGNKSSLSYSGERKRGERNEEADTSIKACTRCRKKLWEEKSQLAYGGQRGRVIQGRERAAF